MKREAKPLDRMLSVPEVADHIGGKAGLARKLIVSGVIPSVLITAGTRRRFFRVRESDLRQWLADREVHQGA